MVIMRYPYTGVLVTVDVSKVGRLRATGWILVEEQPVEAVAPLGAETVGSPEAPMQAPAQSTEPKGSASRAAWRDYADTLGIKTGGMTRAEIRDAVKEVNQ